MLLKDLRLQFEEELNAIYELSEIRQHFTDLCCAYFEQQPTDVVLALHQPISTSKTDKLLAALSQLKSHKPIQYILGFVAFGGLILKVDKSVLIPRPETEELIHQILSNCPDNKPLRVLDIGTGSGCIALSLKKARPKWEISAWDIDKKALDLAQRNAKENTLNVDFHKIDVLDTNLPKTNWDIIVSNPPYVPEAWKKQTKPNVIKHEPLHAIFVPDATPLLFYQHIAVYATQTLNSFGTLYFEGHAPLMKSLKMVLQKAGFSDIVLQNDFRSNPRFIRASLQ